MNRILVSTLLTTLLAACAGTPVPSTQPAAQATPAKSTSATTVQVQPYQDPKNLLSQKRSVYFDLDQYIVKDEYRSTLDAHAKYLANNHSQKIRIEGNTDEQGSREYNLALGNKRAHAVKKIMTLLGVQEGQIETTSWGEEKPKAAGHDEAAWAENRRADIKYGDEK